LPVAQEPFVACFDTQAAALRKEDALLDCSGFFEYLFALLQIEGGLKI
jgi:hypothetical protein